MCKLEMLKSNVSNGSNHTLITTWSGLRGSLRLDHAVWQDTKLTTDTQNHKLNETRTPNTT